MRNLPAYLLDSLAPLALPRAMPRLRKRELSSHDIAPGSTDTGKPELVRPKVPRVGLLPLMAQLPA